MRYSPVRGRGNRKDPFAIAAIRLLIFTGCRRDEILEARWNWVDFERELLNLPDSKTGWRPVHLNPAALEVLRSLPRIDDNPYIIVGAKPGSRWVNLRSVWVRIRNALNWCRQSCRWARATSAPARSTPFLCFVGCVRWCIATDGRQAFGSYESPNNRPVCTSHRGSDPTCQSGRWQKGRSCNGRRKPWVTRGW